MSIDTTPPAINMPPEPDTSLKAAFKQALKHPVHTLATVAMIGWLGYLVADPLIDWLAGGKDEPAPEEMIEPPALHPLPPIKFHF